MLESQPTVVAPVEPSVRQRSRPKHYVVTNYWLDFYCADHCTLCGNWGWIDTRGLRTPAGVPVGRVNYCICPNGQALRAGGAELPNLEFSGGPLGISTTKDGRGPSAGTQG